MLFNFGKPAISGNHWAIHVTMIRANLHNVILLLLIGLMPLGLSAQLVYVEATTDSTDFYIGDWIQINLKARYQQDLKVYFPQLEDTLQELEVLEYGPIDSQLVKGLVVRKQSLKLTVFDSGYYVIPPLTFKYYDPSAERWDSVQTEKSMIMVHTVPVDTTQEIKAIKAPLEVPWTFEEIKWYVYSGIGLVLLIGFVLFLLFRMKEKKPMGFVPKVPPLPPHKLALKKLNTLAGKKLWQKGEVKAYYSELTDIIREYLEGRYGILALESTTAEILEDLTGLITRPELKDPLQQLLGSADLVKFAKAKPQASQNEQVLNLALNFVNETKPTEAEIQAQASAINDPTTSSEGNPDKV